MEPEESIGQDAGIVILRASRFFDNPGYMELTPSPPEDNITRINDEQDEGIFKKIYKGVDMKNIFF